MERWANFFRYAFGSVGRIVVTAIVCLITFQLARKYGWKLLQPDISLGAWGAIIAGCGGGILSWITSVPETKIIQMGESEAAKPNKLSLSDGASAAFFSFALVIGYGYAFVFGIFSFGAAIERGDVFVAIANFIAICVIVLGFALVGSFFTSVPGAIERLFFHARTSPEEFRRIVMRRGFQMLIIGTALQAIEGTKLGDQPPFCDQVRECSAKAGAEAVKKGD